MRLSAHLEKMADIFRAKLQKKMNQTSKYKEKIKKMIIIFNCLIIRYFSCIIVFALHLLFKI
jgi:hypothetical protein